MKGPSLCHGRPVRGRSRAEKTGAALILTLAFIVILTAVVLVFLSRALLQTQVSVASADQTAAALFARGAVDSIIGEFKQEITAGSVATFPPGGSDIRDPNCVFLPITNQAMVPYRMDPTAPANVLKRSAYNLPFYSGTYYNGSWPAPNWAVNFSSTNPGTGGRYISTNRWNAALLVPTYNPASTNTGPVATFSFPDWVYQTRTNGPATAWNANLIPNSTSVSGSLTLNGNCVIGRFAYVVYDEGGLLDVNAAGYPSVAQDSTSITPAMMRNKISEACADLTQIGLNSSDINALVYWRNPVNSTNATTYTNYVYSPNTNAFLTPETFSPTLTERVFTSRQQLIDFMVQNIATNNPPDIERMQGALPYLTTFSRELNEPSWFPQTNMATAGYKYLTLATNTPGSATNAFAPLERAGAIYTNTSLLVCNPNQPVAFSRFPLSRLSWLTTNGVPPAGVTAAQIQSSFGLVWDSSASNPNAWIYAGPSPGVTATGTITPLSQITGREPNFFEILKAAILSGSVNIVPMQCSGSLPSFSRIDSRYGSTNTASNNSMIAIPDQQLMQIGLYMIDQASPAPLPTRIEFGANTNGDWNGALYGSKNLPYIYKFVFSPYRPTTEALTAGSATMFHAWSEPVLWSPYQSAVANTGALQIRIRADGTNSGLLPGEIGATTTLSLNSTTGSQLVAQCLPEVDCGPAGSSTGTLGLNGSSFQINSTSGAAIATATASPVLLASLLSNPAVSYVINDLRAGPPGWGTGTITPPWSPPASDTTNADVYTENGVTYAGFWLGRAYAPNWPVSSQTNYLGQQANYQQALFYSGEGTGVGRGTHSYVLEANYGTQSSPNFLEIQRMVHQYSSGAGVEENDYFTTLQRRLDYLTFNDPRTGRFGFDEMQATGYNATGANGTPTAEGDTTEVTWTEFNTPSQTFSGGFIRNILTNSVSYTPMFNGSTPGGVTSDGFRLADNSATSYATISPAYQEQDGAQRLGDAWYSGNAINTLPMRQDHIENGPVFLGRPFYSVGELGYVYRDMPWRSLNFSSTNSADAGLLDYFCINDGYAGSTNAPVVAGVLDLNTRNPQVLQAMLSGAARAQLYPAYDIGVSTPADVTNIANAITNLTWNSTTPLPLLNKSELATRIAPNDPTVIPSPSNNTKIDTHIKERAEAIVRALASAGQVRTWNLMIDVVAQTGHFPPGATGFNNFIVTAEQRYWAHVAIDRYTGQVISMQLEPVSE